MRARSDLSWGAWKCPMSRDPLFDFPPDPGFNTRNPPEIAKELLFGWRGPVKDFTGMDWLDVDRDLWMRKSIVDARVRVTFLYWLILLFGPRPWVKRLARRIARR